MSPLDQTIADQEIITNGCGESRGTCKLGRRQKNMDGQNHYRNVASHGSALKWYDDKQGASGIPINKNGRTVSIRSRDNCDRGSEKPPLETTGTQHNSNLSRMGKLPGPQTTGRPQFMTAGKPATEPLERAETGALWEACPLPERRRLPPGSKSRQAS